MKSLILLAALVADPAPSVPVPLCPSSIETMFFNNSSNVYKCPSPYKWPKTEGRPAIEPDVLLDWPYEHIPFTEEYEFMELPILPMKVKP